MTQTSLRFLARIREGADSDSWNKLVELYVPLMRKWLRSYEVTGADADDLVQEVLTAVFQELPKFTHNKRTGRNKRKSESTENASQPLSGLHQPECLLVLNY